MHTPADKLHQACHQLKAVAEDIAENPPPRIDFRERLRIERPLFMVIKEACHQYLGYELHGLSEVHRTELNHWMENNGCGKPFQNLARKAFELRVFLLALSSESAYVQGDALSRASLTKKTVLRDLSRALISLAEKAIRIKGEQIKD